ncbi:hypothetical protein AKG98_3461 [Moritella sp. JT01]|uniref:hypothetical protein n=1 Tax=Moritella sp. JT01 TaxID=756698 RepID=UPI000798FCB4|nr:hypothetical protein [Moritella sp. JT01]KXO13243.1 hypothetical protein AKG98_3461 [Moritella sp. JT01]
MKFKRAIFPASILSTVTLMGCNLDTNDEYSPTQTQITAMSGYLGNALICSAEKTKSCNEDRSNVLGTTNSNGKLNTRDTSLQYPLIARVLEGVSFDSDKIGAARKSYTLFSYPGSTVITPFTTIMYTKNIGIQTLAGWLSIEGKFISGDYIALKSNEEDNEQAQRAHLLARTISDLDIHTETDLRNLGKFVTDLVNDGDKLDEIKITRGNANNFTKEEAKHNSLAAYVDGNEFTYRSLNESHPTHEGDYKNGELTIDYNNNQLSVNGSRHLYSYTASGSIIKAPGVGYIDTYYYASDDVALVSTSRSGLDLVTKKSLSNTDSIRISTMDIKLEGNSWFYISPTESLKLADITKFSFNNNKTLTIKINDDNEFEGSWKTEREQLTITSDKVVSYKFEFKINDENVLPVINTENEKTQYGLFIRTSEFAEQIKKLWNKGKH